MTILKCNHYQLFEGYLKVSLMNFIVDFLAMVMIYLTPVNEIPLCGTPPYRLWGTFVIKHLVITVVSGTLIGLLSDVSPRWRAILYGIVCQFVVGQLIHLVLGTKTMFLYKLGLSEIPDGTGRLATPVLCTK